MDKDLSELWPPWRLSDTDFFLIGVEGFTFADMEVGVEGEFEAGWLAESYTPGSYPDLHLNRRLIRKLGRNRLSIVVPR